MKTTVDDHEAYVYTITIQAKDNTFNIIQLYFYADNYAYIITFTTTKESYDIYIDHYQLIINTIDFY